MDNIIMAGKIHTVIFDLDGTLSDSAILTLAAFRNIAQAHGLPMPEEEAIRRATGYANPEFYRILFPGFPADLVEKTGKQVEKEELKVLPYVSGKLLFEGCREIIKRLKDIGIKLNIASTGDKEHVFSILNAVKIIDFFDAVFCGQPDKTEMLGRIIGKTDKAGYVMVGDMKKDYEAARANSILSVGACYGYCKRELANFDLYIDSPIDLLSIIEAVD